MTTADERRTVLPRTERVDAPAYLTRYFERQSNGSDNPVLDRLDDEIDSQTPLYLRRFRERRRPDSRLDAPVPVWEGEELGVTREWAEVTRTREIIPERREQMAAIDCDVYLVRHGETQGYSSESGLTPLGSWQAHRRGQEISRRVLEGHTVAMGCANTNRARQTAEHLRRGLLDGIELYGRQGTQVSEIEGLEEFRNFQVWTPEGFRDVTSAFRLYKKEMEAYERVAMGERPMWLVEMDRFWNVQQGGGDPITHWLTMPMMHFEPPVQAVRRFWAGMQRLKAQTQSKHIIIATHSGPIRAFATWAMGYDPGEPFNTEFVRIRFVSGGKTALVHYRNRTIEVHVPDLDDLPDWWAGLEGKAVPKEVRERGGE